METEQQLLNAIVSGESQAMRRLYDRFSGYTTAIALRYIPDCDAVRDILQDSFVSILTNVRQFDFRGEGTLKAWVARIVVNHAIDWIKEHERNITISDMPKEVVDDDVPDVDDVPPDILDAMIGQLPVGYRTVLNLYVFEQLSHKDIAKRLGIKESSSASQFFHAKKLLAGMIRKYRYSQAI